MSVFVITSVLGQSDKSSNLIYRSFRVFHGLRNAFPRNLVEERLLTAKSLKFSSRAFECFLHCFSYIALQLSMALVLISPRNFRNIAIGARREDSEEVRSARTSDRIVGYALDRIRDRSANLCLDLTGGIR